MANEYSIGEFAKKTAVTVRTLHYYDELGILPPQYTEGGRRYYQDSHFVIMQKIITLKFLGYSLGQIKELLSKNKWDLKDSLQLQKKVMEEQLLQIQHSIKTLDHAINLVDDQEEVDASIFSSIIKGVQEVGEHKEWLKGIYSEEEVEEIYNLSSEKQQELEKKFSFIMSSLKEKYKQDPQNEMVQHLIGELMDMLQEIVGEDLSSFFQRTEGSILNMDDPLNTIPFSDEELTWLREAVKIYLQEHGIN